MKFSIERAARLNVPGSSAVAVLLRRIQTPDQKTVRFVLSRPDTQFGWALASPAASIVDEEIYDADRVQDLDDPSSGRAPSWSTSTPETSCNSAATRTTSGVTSAQLPALVYRSVADSPTIEDAMSKGTVDVVWRGLDAPAVTRFSQQVDQNPNHETINGFTQNVLGGARVLQLEWSPTSRMRSNKELRQAIAVALQGTVRPIPSCQKVWRGTLAFPLAVRPSQVTWKSRINLTLGYDASMPNGQDIATQIRIRLETRAG